MFPLNDIPYILNNLLYQRVPKSLWFLTTIMNFSLTLESSVGQCGGSLCHTVIQGSKIISSHGSAVFLVPEILFILLQYGGWWNRGPSVESFMDQDCKWWASFLLILGWPEWIILSHLWKQAGLCSQGTEETPDVKVPSVSVIQFQATPPLTVFLLLSPLKEKRKVTNLCIVCYI